MPRWYEVDPPAPRHRWAEPRRGGADALHDRHVAVVAVAVVAGALVPAALAVWPAAALAIVAWLRRGRAGWWVLLVAAGALGAAGLSGAAWRAFDQVPTGPWEGPATLVGDPAPVPSLSGEPRVEIVVRVAGKRYIAWLSGRSADAALAVRGGEDIWLDAGRMYPAWGTARRLAIRHIVGEVRVHGFRPLDAGSPLARSVNRVRTAVETSSAVLAPGDAALFRALLYGDDRFVPAVTAESMRGAGLAHLTAVSGQQVALVLLVVQPLLRRLRPWTRWVAALGVIGWFAALTRFEPSVVRASWMAALGVTAYTTGAERRPTRLLALTVVGMVLVDPMVVWAPGWWMSVTATLGVVVLGPRLEAVLPGPDWCRRPLAITLGAQLAVGPVLVAVFGVPPIVAVPANLLALPAAAFVTVAGFPLALGDALLPAPSEVLWLPVRLALTWIVTVARLAERLDPGPAWSAAAWIAIVALLAARAAVALVRYARLRLPLPPG